MLEDVGFTEILISDPVDTFGGAEGEPQARAFEVFGYAFLARQPGAGGGSGA